jgi:beta-aspartyl-peptidase (threonine type)
MIHGGAGTVPDSHEYYQSIHSILTAGQAELAAGRSALDVVEYCVTLLENDPLFNAGRGSVINAKGEIEMDAAVMSGLDLNAGAVAGVRCIKNPIQLARAVMDRSEHVMLLGEGAEEFARANGIKFEPAEYFVTEKRVKQWKEAQKNQSVALDHATEETAERKFGTVGAVARDMFGNLAAATSTGGITNKKFGRVGDSPIVGAGVFADNETCAVSATGYGEKFIRTTLAKTVSEYIRYRGCTAQQAADEAIAYLVHKVEGIGGIIVIDKEGNWGASFSSKQMIFGRADETAVAVLTESGR